MFKFVHAADIHLDSALRGLQPYDGAPVEALREVTRRALQNLVALAIEQRVEFVLIAGDLYDGDWKDHNTGLFLVAQLAQLREAGIATYVVSGNHDAANRMTRQLRLPGNPDGSPMMLSHDQPETVELASLGVALHGRGFATAQVADNVVAQFPMRRGDCFNIGLLHTSLDAGHQGPHACYAPCRISDLCAKQYDYWALGHIHGHRVRQVCEPAIVYPGNLQGRHVREAGAKGCVVVTVDDRMRASTEFHPLDVLRWATCEVDVEGAEDEEAVCDRAVQAIGRLAGQQDGLPLAVRVVLRGRCRLHGRLAARPQRWLQELRACAMQAGSPVWIEKVVVQTRPPGDRADLGLGEGPAGELVHLLRELREDPDMLREVAGELDELTRKLPEEVLYGDDERPLGDLPMLRELLDQVEPMLLGRLVDQEPHA